MAKRVDHDSTMEVSSSQLVPGGQKRPAPHRAPGVDKNDVSMWIGGVVGADEFSGTKTRMKKRPPKGSQIRWGAVVIAVLLVVAIGAGVYYFFIRSSPPAASSKTVPADAAVAHTLDAAAAPATTVDAAVAADAGTDMGAGAGALKADAISGVDGNKPPGKRPATKKKVVKKTATKPATKKPAPKKK